MIDETSGLGGSRTLDGVTNSGGDSISSALRSLDDLELPDTARGSHKRYQCHHHHYFNHHYHHHHNHSGMIGCGPGGGTGGIGGLENDFTATSGLINRLALDSEIHTLMQRSPFTTNQLLYCKNRTSSIYTDSSDDISSLAGSDSLLWDDGSFVLPTNTRSAQIAKIVEYFERKRQVPDNNISPSPPLPLTHSISTTRGSSQQHHLYQQHPPPPPPPVPALYHQQQQQPQHHFYRHHHHHPSSGGGSGSSSSSVAAAVAASYLSYDSRRYNDFRRHPSTSFNTDYESFCFDLDKRPPSSQVRLTVCEGAVKSKLQIFDKTKQQKMEQQQQEQQSQNGTALPVPTTIARRSTAKVDGAAGEGNSIDSNGLQIVEKEGGGTLLSGSGNSISSVKSAGEKTTAETISTR